MNAASHMEWHDGRHDDNPMGCGARAMGAGWLEHNSTGRAELTHPHNSTGAECSSDTAPASGMSAKEIAARSPGLWTTEASGCAYPTSQRRVRILIETNGDWDALRYEIRDPYADCEEFAQDLLAIVGDDLSARDQLALIRVLTARLTACQVRRGCEDDPVATASKNP